MAKRKDGSQIGSLTPNHQKLRIDLISLRTKSKVMGPQSCGSPNFGNFRTPKCHLDVSIVERHKIYYKGEDGGFP